MKAKTSVSISLNINFPDGLVHTFSVLQILDIQQMLLNCGLAVVTTGHKAASSECSLIKKPKLSVLLILALLLTI